MSLIKPYFIGIDSDGTVFDSMEIKHKCAFQPAAIDLWKLNEVEGLYTSICESINLYSSFRGINRFEGLALAFERICDQSEEARILLEGHEALQAFVRAGYPLSSEGLSHYQESKPHPFLLKVLDWSHRSDELYAEEMERAGNPSFPGVGKILSRASVQSEVVVISSSSCETLKQDWGQAGLLPYVTRVEGQEQGNKSKQLNSALSGGREPECAMMIGDALSDLEAAQAHGILFYPITPGAEAVAWQRFDSEALDRFYNGTYAGAYEQALLSEFKNVLQPDDAMCASSAK